MKKSHFPKSVCVAVCRIFSMANDICRKFKQNQIIFCICARVVEDLKPVDFGEDRLSRKDSFLQRFTL